MIRGRMARGGRQPKAKKPTKTQQPATQQPAAQQEKKEKPKNKQGHSGTLLFLIFCVAITAIVGIRHEYFSSEKPDLSPVSDTGHEQIKEKLHELEKSQPEDLFPQLKTVLHGSLFRFQDFCVFGSNVWAAGYRTGYHDHGYLIYSKDSGKSWETLLYSEDKDFIAIRFFDENNGFLVTETELWKTSDGGTNWQTILVTRNMPEFAIYSIEDVKFQSKENITVLLKGNVGYAIETQNTGKTWNYVIYHSQYCGSKIVKSKSVDQGKSWQKP